MRSVAEPQTARATARNPEPVASPGTPQPPPPHGFRHRLHGAAHALSRQPHLQAIRDGVVGALPIILLGSGFLLLWQPPWPGLSRFLPPQSALRAGYLACAGMVSIYACAATALSLARRHEADLAASVTTALAVFLVAQKTVLLQGGGVEFGLYTMGAVVMFPMFVAADYKLE